MEQQMKPSPYRKFAVTLAISCVTMYLAMFLNVDSMGHIHLSLTRLYMTLLMVSPMALTMLWMMRQMYFDKRLNLVIALASIATFVISLILLRAQTPIGDQQYMKAMIPHHSSAILTSKHAQLDDPEVKALAKQIIQSQEEEIAQMEAILERMDH